MKEIKLLVNKKGGWDKEYTHFELYVIVPDDRGEGKPRNFRHHEFDGDKPYEYFNDLKISCMLNKDLEKSFGWTIEYHSPWTVDIHNVEKMAKTLKRIDNKLTKLEREDSAVTFGDYAHRIAKTIKAKRIVFYEDYDNIVTGYDSNNYVEYPLTKGCKVLDEMIQEVLDKYKE